MLCINDFRRAQENLKQVVHRTGVQYADDASRISGAQVYLKLENMQRTGSFKVRGAYNKIKNLTGEQKRHGVITASAGNHAQGVALGAQQAGIPATVVMPEDAPISKVVATERYGAKVVLFGKVYDEAYGKAKEIQQQTGATFIHAFDDLDVIAGQGTIGLELLEQLPQTELIFVPVGGGGLASGVALAVKLMRPDVKVIGVEAAGAACLTQSRRVGVVCTLQTASTIADGIAVKRPGDQTFAILQQYLDDVVTVDDEEIAGAMLSLMEKSKLVAEGAGATALAALLYKKYPVQGKNAVAVLSGGNVDVNMLARIIEKGLIKSGRKLKLTTVLRDEPGTLAALLALLSGMHANIVSIVHNRNRIDVPLGGARVELELETRSAEHGDELMRALKEYGYPVMLH